MNTSKLSQYPASARSEYGFSLIEVVLAIGIFLVTVLALVGMLGPTLQSVDEVEKTDEIASVVNTVNAFLQSSPDIAVSGQSKFETIYKELREDGKIKAFVFRAYDSNDNVSLVVGFDKDFEVGNVDKARVLATDIRTDSNVIAAGPVYRVFLTASSVTPEDHRTGSRDGNGVYYLNKNFLEYPEGYLAMEVRIFAEEPGATFVYETSLQKVKDLEPLFTYNTAVVR
jgi:Tfp pilus assembly protein PilV